MTTQRCQPTLDHELAFWRAGYRLVAGSDEVGRGALAGPLVAAAVILPMAMTAPRLLEALHGCRDSKQLDHGRRIALLPRIEAVAVSIGVGIVPARELDAIGVGPANRLAIERAVLALREVDALLLDATVIEHVAPQVGLIDGDQHSLSIAAASIIAKVTRDLLMIDLHATYPNYRFQAHKGYGTSTHIAALDRHGPCPEHRRSFAPIARLLGAAS